MSMIGIIAVYKCDGCGAVKTLHTDLDLKSFSEWISGKVKDFCPACKFTNVEAKPPVQTDLATERVVALVSGRLRAMAAARDTHSFLEKEAA